MLVVEVAGAQIGGFGRVTVAGTASLAGTLRLEFVDGFTPVAGQTLTVLEYGSHVAAFTTIDAPLLDPELVIVPAYQDTFLLLTIELQ